MLPINYLNLLSAYSVTINNKLLIRYLTVQSVMGDKLKSTTVDSKHSTVSACSRQLGEKYTALTLK